MCIMNPKTGEGQYGTLRVPPPPPPKLVGEGSIWDPSCPPPPALNW